MLTNVQVHRGGANWETRLMGGKAATLSRHGTGCSDGCRRGSPNAHPERPGNRSCLPQGGNTHYLLPCTPGLASSATPAGAPLEPHFIPLLKGEAESSGIACEPAWGERRPACCFLPPEAPQRRWRLFPTHQDTKVTRSKCSSEAGC